MTSFLTSLCRDTRGTTSIEYALICGMIFLVIVGAVRGLGGENGGAWDQISSKVRNASQSAAG